MFPNNSPMLGMSGMAPQPGQQPGGVSPFSQNFQTQQQFQDPNQWLTNMQSQMAAGQQPSSITTPTANPVTPAASPTPSAAASTPFTLPAASTPTPTQTAAAAGASPSPGQTAQTSQQALIQSIMSSLAGQNSTTAAPASGSSLSSILTALGLGGGSGVNTAAATNGIS